MLDGMVHKVMNVDLKIMTRTYLLPDGTGCCHWQGVLTLAVLQLPTGCLELTVKGTNSRHAISVERAHPAGAKGLEGEIAFWV